MSTAISFFNTPMVTFKAKIQKFEKKGEKTGWTFIEISNRQAEKMNPECKVSFRVKGKLDNYSIERVAILPMGDGNFILPFNAEIRKGTGKKAGDTISATLALDERGVLISSDFIKCLKDDPIAHDFYKSLPKGHQNYFSKWIDSAKTTATKTKRITMAVMALAMKQGYPEMIRANKIQGESKI
jgi:hypothetical protein